MYKKETTDEKYQNNPCRVDNFQRDEEGNLTDPITSSQDIMFLIS